MGRRILIILAIILVGVVCFFLGRHSNEDRIKELESFNEKKAELIQLYEKHFDELSDSAQVEIDSLYSIEL